MEHDILHRHTVRDECRILLVHGLLHTLGHDHEEDEAGLQAMVDHETSLLAALEWQVSINLALPKPLQGLCKNKVYDASRNTNAIV